MERGDSIHSHGHESDVLEPLVAKEETLVFGEEQDEVQCSGVEVWEEVKKQCWIAGPMVSVNLLQFSVSVISVMLVGHLGELAFASASIATSIASVTGFSVLQEKWICISLVSEQNSPMAQRGAHMIWGRRAERNARRRGNVEEEVIRRLQALEARLLPNDSEEEPEIQRGQMGEASPMERLIEAISKQGTRVKVEAPNFKGELNPEMFLDWIQELEKFYDMEGLEETDPRRVKIAASKMKSHATLWWENLHANRMRLGKEKIKSWPKMLKHLKVKFLPSNYQQIFFRDFQNLKQRELSVSAYTEEFLRLRIRTNLQEDDEHTVAGYINRLKFQLQDELALLKLNTVDETYQIALKAKEKLNRKGKATRNRWSNYSNRCRGSSSRSANEEESENDSKPQSQGRGGFRGRGRGPPFSGNWRPLRCFICNEPHRAMERVMMAQDGERVEPVLEEVEAETGENFMLRRTLIDEDKETPTADWRRNNVVRTQCKCKNKVCKVIVDGGSTDNLLSAEMMQKLQLVFIPKPNPYKISWLKRDHSVLVNQSCLVGFKIGPYEDEVLCDVVPMDAYHLLLGRPWLYDRNVLHHGRANTYEIQHAGKLHILKPFKGEKANETTALSLFTVGSKEFFRASQ